MLPEKLAPGVYRVDALAIPYAISVLLVADRDGWTLVETGMQGSVPRIQAALAALGANPADLRRIYLTHHHADHIGGLPRLGAWAPDAEIVASEPEAQIIADQRPPDPFSNAFFRALNRWQRLPKAPVSRVAREGDTIAGFRVIATPGHTLGHTSLLSEQHRLLVTGDAFGCLPFKLRVGVRRGVCTDPAQARRSAARLLEEDFTTVVLSHGPVLRDGAKQRLRQAMDDE